MVSRLLMAVGAVAATLSSACSSAQPVADTGARLTAELFVKREFDGYDPARLEMAKFSEAYVKRHNLDEDPLGGYVVSWSADPIVVVKTYKVGDITITGTSALVNVQYDRVLRSEGDGDDERTLIRDEMNEVVALNLSSEGGRWVVVDPPEPHISLCALIWFYEGEVKQMTDVVKSPLASDHQKALQRKAVDVLNVLRALEAHCSRR